MVGFFHPGKPRTVALFFFRRGSDNGRGPVFGWPPRAQVETRTAKKLAADPQLTGGKMMAAAPEPQSARDFAPCASARIKCFAPKTSSDVDSFLKLWHSVSVWHPVWLFFGTMAEVNSVTAGLMYMQPGCMSGGDASLPGAKVCAFGVLFFPPCPPALVKGISGACSPPASRHHGSKLLMLGVWSKHKHPRSGLKGMVIKPFARIPDICICF